MPATPSATASRNPGGLLVFGLLFAYLAAHVILRVLVSGNVQLDESQQLLLTQELHWGYGSQPPLYTWMQAGVFQLLGVNIAALALLKHLVLGGTYVFVFRCVKKITGDTAAALAAMSSLLLLPQIAWESQRDQSHSVLSTMAAAAALYFFICLVRKPKPLTYLLLGVSTAAGCLGKYNYAIFIVSLLLAIVSLPEFRPVLRHRWAWLCPLIFAAALLPHALWMRDHPATLFREATKLYVPQSASLAQAYAAGLWTLMQSGLAFSGPAVLVFGLLFWRKNPGSAEAPDTVAYRKLLGRMMLIGLLLCVVLVFAGRARFRDRWMQPLLFVTPIYLVLLVQSRLPAGGWRRLWWFNGVVAANLLVLQPGVIYLETLSKDNKRMSRPYATLAGQIKQHGFTNGVICTGEMALAGNLKLHFPQSRVILPECAWFAAPADVPWLGVWETSAPASAYPSVTNLITTLRGDNVGGLPPTELQAVGRLGNSKPTRLKFILLPARGRSVD